MQRAGREGRRGEHCCPATGQRRRGFGSGPAWRQTTGLSPSTTMPHPVRSLPTLADDDTDPPQRPPPAPQPRSYPAPTIYAATATGRGRPPVGGMRRQKPTFNLNDITRNHQSSQNPDDSPAQIRNPPFTNRALLGAGRPSTRDGPQSTVLPQPQRRLPTDLGSPFANFSRIVSVSSCPSSLSFTEPFHSSDPSGTLNFNGKAILHAEGVNFSNGAKFSISMDQLKLDMELGKGNYGTVKKVLHVPTNVYMAMKVRPLPLFVFISGPLLRRYVSSSTRPNSTES